MTVSWVSHRTPNFVEAMLVIVPDVDLSEDQIDAAEFVGPLGIKAKTADGLLEVPAPFYLCKEPGESSEEIWAIRASAFEAWYDPCGASNHTYRWSSDPQRRLHPILSYSHHKKGETGASSRKGIRIEVACPATGKRFPLPYSPEYENVAECDCGELITLAGCLPVQDTALYPGHLDVAGDEKKNALRELLSLDDEDPPPADRLGGLL